MTFTKLSTVDAFVVVDLDNAPVASGIVRLAPKILTSGVEDLARSLTYTYASLGMTRSGASAGINSPDDTRGDAIAAFVTEWSASASTVLIDAGKGVAVADLSPLRTEDPRRLLSADDHEVLAASGAVAAAEHALGGLDGQRVAIEGFGASSNALVAQLLERGAKIVALSTPQGMGRRPAGFSAEELASPSELLDPKAEPAFKVFGAECDALFVGSKSGALDHKGAGFVTARAVVPTGTIPVTAKALATLRRANVAVLPDFVTQAGPVIAAWGDSNLDQQAMAAAVTTSVRAILDECQDHPDGVLLAACYRAEAYLSTWRDKLPFGRPLAA